MSTTTNLKKEMRSILKETGENPKDVIFVIQREAPAKYYGWDYGPKETVTFDELPTNNYDMSYGGVNGPRCIGFGPKYVYVQCVYDGSQWYEAIPKTPDLVGEDIRNYG